ncbi:gas vesicle protein [Kitasatospora sp. DSM 101779]|uniref:gas vesicle protein n=1 Tax=Kitasatospora sp. DSM 101779 TaxID=2853165 RepID=UPI0021DB3D9C|nr:gas vesicle protein [Kitasatospora sp. DSM 101779]MCU7826938.1 gas vesicle protein [Kitasatospora sp. DSM 101779]
MPREARDAEPAPRRTGRSARSARGAEDGEVRATRTGGHTVSVARAMRTAASQLAELLGRAPESVSGIRRTEEGWEAEVEVVEVERIPETSSVMASYRVLLDTDGELIGYERTRRYTRAEVDRRPS